MKTIITELQKIIENFRASVDNWRESADKLNTENEQYVDTIREAKTAEIESAFLMLTDQIRNKAKTAVSDVIARARSYVALTVAEIDRSELEKIDAVFKVSDNPSRYVLQVLIDSLDGSFWGLSYLQQKTTDKSNASTLIDDLIPKVPQPEYYEELFTEMRDACNRFIDAYNGSNDLINTTQENVSALLFLSNTPWLDWAERMNICPNYLTESSVIGEALTASERKFIEAKMGAALRSTESAQVEKIREILKNSPTTRRVLMKSRFSPIVEAIEGQEQQEKALEVAGPLENAFTRWNKLQEEKEWKKKNRV